jgi:hypothetical protein
LQTVFKIGGKIVISAKNVQKDLLTPYPKPINRFLQILKVNL